MSKPKPTKRIMHSFNLAEISAVDKPAQEGAVAVLIKRADDAAVDTSVAHAHPSAIIAKDGYTFTVGMTTAEEGHQHIVQMVDGVSSGYTDCAKIEGVTVGELERHASYHSHPWVKTGELVTIGESDGHTHLLMAASEVAAAATTTTEEDMTTKAQEQEVVKADDAVVYTTADGCQIRKSHGDVALAQAKRNDELAKQVGDMVKAAEITKAEIRKADLCKRAVALFKNLPGTEAQQGEMLGAIEAITDEETRKAALAMVVAGNLAMAGAYKRSGSNDPVTDAPKEAYQKGLEAFAKAEGKLPGQVIVKFNQTKEGAELYSATR
jgi:hypothetical protein